ncbi:MAG: endonuclease/exonuclease/phosphatase family protein [Actinomycetota bacterium]|nr:endonuclease/exonuclease/phosphatase family protein [Actinomycetota bacterium]
MAAPDAAPGVSSNRLRVLTLNLWGTAGAWAERRAVLRDGLRELRPDVVGFQEAIKTDEQDTAAEVIGAEYRVVHQTTGLRGDGTRVAIATRWPVRDVRELDQQLTPRTADFPATTVVVEVEGPDPIGPLLFVNHLPSWKPELELERELQTVAAARFVEKFVRRRPMHVVLAGDLDAVPDASSIRFLRGLQSLGGMSVCYRDAWESIHAEEPGHTFTLRNPLVMEESDVRQERSRRIDYIFVRCDEHGPTLAISACALAFAEPVDGVWASDHFGVIADLEASSPAPTR